MARSKAFIRRRDRLNLRLLDRPLLNAWRQTRESKRCTNLLLRILCFSMRHFNDVRTARISNTLMCSVQSFHCHPAMVFQRHKRAGTLARNLWYLTKSSLEDCSIKSSPFTPTKVRSFLTSFSSFPVVGSERATRISGRCRKLWKSLLQPGEVLLYTCWTLSSGFNPRTAPNWLRIHATTVTFPRVTD